MKEGEERGEVKEEKRDELIGEEGEKIEDLLGF